MTLPPGFPLTISREHLLDLPIRRYDGEIHLMATGADLERALDAIRAERVLGFDTETRPAFRPGESYLPCLAQAATAHAVYLFPLERLDCSGVIAEFLSSARIVKAGVALADDLRQLKHLFDFQERAVRDLGTVARGHGLKQSGVRNLAAMFLGIRIAKGTKTSNWAAPRLSAQQVLYAATDAWICRELWLRFEEMGLLASAAHSPPS